MGWCVVVDWLVMMDLVKVDDGLICTWLIDLPGEDV